MASDELMPPPNGKRSRTDFESTNEAASVDAEGFQESYNYLSITNSAIVSSSSDDDLGPALPTTAPKKKRRKLPYEKTYISALPASSRYSKSLMHKDQVSFVTFTPFTEFLITSSLDGAVKFWKKSVVGIESVKEFKAHNGEIKNVGVSQDGRSFATAGLDQTIKIFDVITFGMKFPPLIMASC